MEPSQFVKTVPCDIGDANSRPHTSTRQRRAGDDSDPRGRYEVKTQGLKIVAPNENQDRDHKRLVRRRRIGGLKRGLQTLSRKLRGEQPAKQNHTAQLTNVAKRRAEKAKTQAQILATAVVEITLSSKGCRKQTDVHTPLVMRRLLSLKILTFNHEQYESAIKSRVIESFYGIYTNISNNQLETESDTARTREYTCYNPAVFTRSR